jgi:anti-sigma factor ChrR (cupin superfamily)
MSNLEPIDPNEIVPIKVGPGCTRRDLPSDKSVRIWIVEMEPGSQWPYEDVHDETGEQVLILSGELIEGDRRFGAGTYLNFGPDSRHQPRTETGAKLFGVNVKPADRRSHGVPVKSFGGTVITRLTGVP